MALNMSTHQLTILAQTDKWNGSSIHKRDYLEMKGKGAYEDNNI